MVTDHWSADKYKQTQTIEKSQDKYKKIWTNTNKSGEIQNKNLNKYRKKSGQIKTLFDADCVHLRRCN